MLTLTDDMTEALDGFEDGSYRESDLIRFIEQHLLTDDQRALLAQAESHGTPGASVHDLLNGHVRGSDYDSLSAALFPAWNAAVGRMLFCG